MYSQISSTLKDARYIVRNILSLGFDMGYIRQNGISLEVSHEIDIILSNVKLGLVLKKV